MSQETNWFAEQREYSRPIIFPLIGWLAAIGFTIFLLVLALVLDPKSASCKFSVKPMLECRWLR